MLARTIVDSERELYDQLAERLALSYTVDRGRCIADDQDYYWQGALNVFYEQGKLIEASMVSRLVAQIRKSLDRFMKLFNAYSYAFDSKNVVPLSEKSLGIHNKYTDNIANEFTSLLDELMGLRDAINSITFRLILGNTQSFSTKNFRKSITTSISSDLKDLVVNSMFDDENGDMLLSDMATYRNVSIHCLGQVNPVTGNTVVIKKHLGSLGEIQQIVFPLYDRLDTLKEIERETPKGFAFVRDKDDYFRFLQEDTHLDAMHFAFDCLTRILTICKETANSGRFESRLRVIDGSSATFTVEPQD